MIPVLRIIPEAAIALLRLVGILGESNPAPSPKRPVRSVPARKPAGAHMRDGKRTTEFWLTIAWYVFHIVSAIVTGEAPSPEVLAGSAAPLVGYQVARGLAKKPVA